MSDSLVAGTAPLLIEATNNLIDKVRPVSKEQCFVLTGNGA